MLMCVHAGAEPERVKREIEEIVGLDCSNAIMASAKQVDDLSNLYCKTSPSSRYQLPCNERLHMHV